MAEEKNGADQANPVVQGYDPALPTIQDFDPKLTHEVARENAAKELAGQLVSTFKFAVWGSILGTFILLFWMASQKDLDKATEIIAKGAVPMFGSITTFASSVFGPLLAFVLGYYFGEKNRK